MEGLEGYKRVQETGVRIFPLVVSNCPKEEFVLRKLPRKPITSRIIRNEAKIQNAVENQKFV